MRMLLLLIGVALGVGATLLVLDATRGTLPAAARGAAGAADNDEEVPARVRHVEGVNVVVLTGEERALAGIETATPRAVTLADEERSVGRVVDSAGLLEGHRELRVALAAARAQQAITDTLGARRDRLRAWSARGEIAVAKELAELEVQYRRELDAGNARAAEVERLRSALVARWGPALAVSAKPPPAWLDAVAAGTAQLIEFTAAATPASLVAAPDERRDHATAVQVLGGAPAVLGAAQRATYYGVMQRTDLRIGMRLTCWIARDAAPRAGLLVPHAALVWQGGQRGFFVEVAPGRFARQAAGAALAHPDGLLVTRGLATASALVVRGAQALLAEEFRAQIPEEDDD